jgi:hypothetical protein
VTHHFTPTQYGVMPIHLMAAAIILSQEASEAGVPAAAARISRQSETDGRSTTEI